MPNPNNKKSRNPKRPNYKKHDSLTEGQFVKIESNQNSNITVFDKFGDRLKANRTRKHDSLNEDQFEVLPGYANEDTEKIINDEFRELLSAPLTFEMMQRFYLDQKKKALHDEVSLPTAYIYQLKKIIGNKNQNKITKL